MAAPAPPTADAPGMKLDPKYDDYDFPVVTPDPQPGHPGHLTSEQQAQVDQLRLMLESEGYTQRLDTITLVWSPSTKHSRGSDTDVLISAAAIPACPQV